MISPKLRPLLSSTGLAKIADQLQTADIDSQSKGLGPSRAIWPTMQRTFMRSVLGALCCLPPRGGPPTASQLQLNLKGNCSNSYPHSSSAESSTNWYSGFAGATDAARSAGGSGVAGADCSPENTASQSNDFQRNSAWRHRR